MFNTIQHFVELRSQFTMLGDCPHKDDTTGYTGDYTTDVSIDDFASAQYTVALPTYCTKRLAVCLRLTIVGAFICSGVVCVHAALLLLEDPL
jgi:hypothetical protein